MPAAGLLYCVGRDMTERKRIHRELEQSEERHRAITETAHDAIIVADADGTVRFWNPVAERVFGFAAAPPAPETGLPDGTDHAQSRHGARNVPKPQAAPHPEVTNTTRTREDHP